MRGDRLYRWKFYVLVSLIAFIRTVSGQFQSNHPDNDRHRTNDEGTSIEFGTSRQLINNTVGLINELRPFLSGNRQTIGDVVFNVHHFTQFVFDGNQVYVYSPKKNEENIQEPQKWTFFYVPILQPVQSSLILPWITVNLLEVRVRLALGTTQVEEAARRAISNQFSREIVEKYSKLWVIAPLMLDSLTAYIVTVGSTPVPGVAPFHIDNPNANIITFRFVCLSRESALLTAAGLLTGTLDIEVSFYFSGMHRVKTNMMTITATHLQAIVSKTIADGGGTNSTYIHRDQANHFIGKYITNVKKLIYLEEPDANISLLTYGLVEQLIALFHESMANAREVHILANAFGQVWHSADLHPDRITSEMGKLFTFNQSETQRHNNKQNYYSVNQRRDSCLPAHTPLDVRIRTIFTIISLNSPVNHHPQVPDIYESATHNAVSEADIIKAAEQVSIEGAWHGHKFFPKAFKVFRLTDIVDRLQVAVIGKQLLAEKANGAVIRRVNALHSLSSVANLFGSLDNSSLFASLENASLLATLTNTDFITSTDENNTSSSNNERSNLVGEIKIYAGSESIPALWLPCDGAIVSRTLYPRLFAAIGTMYGSGRDSNTFKLPDLRGRVPLGVDTMRLRANQIVQLGTEGGAAQHTLTLDELPSHSHQRGTLQTAISGLHSHSVNDPGHQHGNDYSTQAVASAIANDYGIFNQQAHGYRQWQSMHMPTAFTQISLALNGSHGHVITGQTSSVGANSSFSILPPFQAFQYIIYAG